MNTCIISTFNRKKGSSSPLLEIGGGGAWRSAGVGGGCREEIMQCAILTSLLEATRTLEQHREGFNSCGPGALTRYQPRPLLSTSGWETARAHWEPWPGSRVGCFLGFVSKRQCPSRQAPWSEPAQQCGKGFQHFSLFLWLHLCSPCPSPAYAAHSLLSHSLMLASSFPPSLQQCQGDKWRLLFGMFVFALFIL